MARKAAPHSAAAARATSVLPVPGGPNSSTPLLGLWWAADRRGAIVTRLSRARLAKALHAGAQHDL